jgi:hypothetical protein
MNTSVNNIEALSRNNLATQKAARELRSNLEEAAKIDKASEIMDLKEAYKAIFGRFPRGAKCKDQTSTRY